MLLEWVGPWPCFAPFLSGQLSWLCLFGNWLLEGNWKEVGMELWCPWGGSESTCLPAGTHHPLLESPTVVWSEEKCRKWLGGPCFCSHSNRFVGFMVLVDNNYSIGDNHKALHHLFHRAPFCQCSSAAGQLFSLLACDRLKSQFKCIQLAGKSVWISAEFSFVLHTHAWVSVQQLLVLTAIWACWSIAIGTYHSLGNSWAVTVLLKL